MTLTDLITAIKAAIYPNGAEEITGQILQDTLVQMAQTGVTPSGDPMHYAYVACGATWNDSTGYWELNTLTDITNDQMREIYVYGIGSWNRTDATWICAYENTTARTTLPSPSTTGGEGYPMFFYFTFSGESLEVIQILQNASATAYLGRCQNAFSCTQCKMVVNPLDVAQCPANHLSNKFSFNMPLCTKLYLARLQVNLNISIMYSYGLDSLTYLVDNANNSGAITVTVHPTIYGYLTDQSGHPDWYALAQTAAGKNISFVSA